MTRLFRLSWLVVAIALLSTPALADQYLIYTQGGIPLPGEPARTTELWTWCDQGQPCVEEFSACGGPEGERTMRADGNAWSGLGIFLNVQSNAIPGSPPVDLSQYMDGDLKFWIKAPTSAIGAFNIKVEMQCAPAGSIITNTVSISDHGWDGTSNFQELTIPLSAFSTDPACFQNVVSPFMSTIENLPFFNSFFVDYVRWETPVSNPGRSIVTTQGRQLFVDGEPFVINGVAYSPLGVGENWQGAWADRPDRYNIDFPLMAAAGVNTVRLYAPILSKAMLDAAWAEGLYVIPQYNIDAPAITCPVGQANTTDRFIEMVNTWKDHPAVLFWLIGNEVNANLGAADLCGDWYPLLDAMAAAAKAAEGANPHPVATAVAEVDDICIPGCSDDTALPNVDLWGMQVYRGCDATTAYNDYAAKADCNRPVVVTETGADAYDSDPGVVDEFGQSVCLGQILNSGNNKLALLGASGVSSGQVIFAWADEWWKADEICGTGWEIHDTCTSFDNFAYPDPGINEEWWGIVGLNDGDPDDRTIRNAYTTVSGTFWELGPAQDLAATSYTDGTGAVGVSFTPGDNATDHTLYYGPLGAVSTYGYSGSVSGLGASGTGSALIPPGSHFFMVVSEVFGAEGCYGSDSDCNERPASPGAVKPQSANRYCSACP
jgi:hypothetical protein